MFDRLYAARLIGLVSTLALSAACGGDDDGPASADDAGVAPDLATVLDAGDVTDGGMPDLGPEPCSSEGETRLSDCGSCGMQQQTCSGGTWEPTSECLGEGECAPGALDQENTDMCGERQRLCSATCTWNDWSLTEAEGECVAGTSRETDEGCGPDQTKQQFCTDGCAWEDMTACESSCGPLRTAPMDSEEVCVPAGPFIRGDDRETNAPSATVMMSAYVIDRYPVTFRRYRACRAASGCRGDLYSPEAEAEANDDAFLDYPVRDVSYAQAIEFCAWDGGRHLTTEAEWEKAVRGPAPRDNGWTYGDTYECSRWPDGSECGARNPRAPIGSYAAVSGYYIEDSIIPESNQWMSDWYASAYFSHPSSLSDPTGAPAGTQRVFKGSMGGERLTRISQRAPAYPEYRGAFRCARSAL